MVGKAELVKDLSEALGENKKRSAEILAAVIDTIQGYLAEGKGVRLIPFGNFHVVTRNGRKGRRPGSEEEIYIEAREVPVFKPGKALKDAVNAKK
ncbi:HU family DNA-binding protein [bacterium]|nr:HU family DNA-binding protein [bacterium]